MLGDLTDCTVAELGAGAGHQAAYVAAELGAARVVVIDSSAAQHARSNNVYEDVCGLDFVFDDAATYLQAHPGSLDVVYSVFGALDFTDPRALLPAAPARWGPGVLHARALPNGRATRDGVSARRYRDSYA